MSDYGSILSAMGFLVYFVQTEALFDLIRKNYPSMGIIAISFLSGIAGGIPIIGSLLAAYAYTQRGFSPYTAFSVFSIAAVINIVFIVSGL